MSDEYGSAYTSYQINRGALRKFIRRIFLKRAARALEGPTLDFGCGIGELLVRLPPGSVGLEYNRVSVDLCRRKGLHVDWYDGYADDWRLGVLPEGSHFQSMIVSHVLEHLDTPMDVLGALLRSVERLGTQRVVLIVPGPAGYRSDPTHRTFVDFEMLQKALAVQPGWNITSHCYFPLDTPKLGRWFRYHELQVVLSPTS